MESELKVLFDISWLARESNSPFQGGIERTIFEITDRLKTSDGIDLSFEVNGSYETKYLSKRRFEKFRNDSAKKFSETADYKVYEGMKFISEKGGNEIFKRAGSFFSRQINRSKRSFPGGGVLKKFDIYHSPFSPLPEMRKNSHVKRFLTIHDLLPVFKPELTSEKFRNLFFEILSSIQPDDRVICVSKHTKAQLCGHLKALNPDNVSVIYPGVSDFFKKIGGEETRNNIREKYNLGPNAYVLALVNQKRKNVEHLIECFKALLSQKEIEDLSLVLVGDPINYPKQIANNKDIYFLTNVTDDDLRTLYNNALMFVYASLFEGFGMPPLEAMKCGTPVIAGSATSVPEVVGDAGILVDPQSSKALFDAMFNLYSRSDLRNELIQKGFRQAENFCWQKCVNETVTAYKEALKSRECK